MNASPVYIQDKPILIAKADPFQSKKDQFISQVERALSASKELIDLIVDPELKGQAENNYRKLQNIRKRNITPSNLSPIKTEAKGLYTKIYNLYQAQEIINRLEIANVIVKFGIKLLKQPEIDKHLATWKQIRGFDTKSTLLNDYKIAKRKIENAQKKIQWFRSKQVGITHEEKILSNVEAVFGIYSRLNEKIKTVDADIVKELARYAFSIKQHIMTKIGRELWRADALALIGKPMPVSKKFSLERYKGKLLLLFFWRIKCSPCLDEMSLLNEIYDTYKKNDLEILGVALDSSTAEVDTVKAQYEFSLVADRGNIISAKYKTVRTPTVFAIKDDKIVDVFIGKKGREEFEELLRKQGFSLMQQHLQ